MSPVFWYLTWIGIVFFVPEFFVRFKNRKVYEKKIFHDYYILLSILANIVFTQQNQQKMDSGHNLPVFSMQK